MIETRLEKSDFGSHFLVEPIDVRIVQESETEFRATAPKLGLWMDGYGETEAAAVEDLTRVIVEQKDEYDLPNSKSSSPYDQAIRSIFAEYFAGRSDVR